MLNKILTFLFVLLALSILLSLPVMWLWNYVIPYISSSKIPELNIFQALALNILCSLLFKSGSNTSK